jgi:hypothetical protein
MAVSHQRCPGILAIVFSPLCLPRADISASERARAVKTLDLTSLLALALALAAFQIALKDASKSRGLPLPL